LGLLAACGIVAFVGASCGSSNSGSDNGMITHKDGGIGAIVGDGSSGDAADAALSVDGTTGQPCKTDADCVGDTGPGINRCSGTQTFPYSGIRVTLLPTPVCMGPLIGSSCDPAPPNDMAGANLHFCDGPDLPSSPGVCLPNTSPAQPGMGTCYVKCTYSIDGTAPTGCIGHNTCTQLGLYLGDVNTGLITTGVGFCQGTCLQDSDCSDLGAGWVCQTDVGLCTKSKITRTKTIGTACSAARDLTTGHCNCPPDLVNSTTQNGYCTQACVVGAQVNPCPAGWVCDNLSNAQLPDGTTLPAENVQTAGECVPLCPGDGGSVAEAGPGPTPDAASDASSDASSVVPEASAPPLTACPANSTCQANTPVGVECIP
jgi:hypothetical protein